MKETYQDWPNMLREVREIVGTELALKLARECGGIEKLYIPTRPQPGHPWLQCVGPEAYARLAEQYAEQRVTLPRGTYIRLAKRQILELAEAGISRREIAVQCRVSERYVRRVLALVEQGQRTQ